MAILTWLQCVVRCQLRTCLVLIGFAYRVTEVALTFLIAVSSHLSMDYGDIRSTVLNEISDSTALPNVLWPFHFWHHEFLCFWSSRKQQVLRHLYSTSMQCNYPARGTFRCNCPEIELTTYVILSTLLVLCYMQYVCSSSVCRDEQL